jgi:hypothetical protein
MKREVLVKVVYKNCGAAADEELVALPEDAMRVGHLCSELGKETSPFPELCGLVLESYAFIPTWMARACRSKKSKSQKLLMITLLS